MLMTMNVVARTGILSLMPVLLILGGAGGCREGASYTIAGTVHFADEPVQFGTLRFTPDLDRGNDGPSVTVPIADGQFTTRGARASATPGFNIALIEVSAASADEPRSTYYEVPVTLPETGVAHFSIDLSTAAPVR